VGVLAIYFTQGFSFDMTSFTQTHVSADKQIWIFPLLFLGFGVFTALFPLHTWVPDGHSSAPTAGSMFLAGISMKLGGFGCLRVATILMPEAAKIYEPYIILLAVIAIIYGAFATMMQKDMKYMNAYSSISHCGFVLLGIGFMNKVALTGAVLQMVSHGLMTALFFAVIGMIYERTHTRQIPEMSGLLKRMPFIITVLFLSGLCSLGLPGLSGFVSEMTIFSGAWQQEGFWYHAATIVAAMSIVVTAVYILKAVTAVSMGTLKAGFEMLDDARWNERLAAYVLIAGILVIGLAPQWLSSLIDNSWNALSIQP
jgi:NADH-quinone oxidoreductase subunit M